MPVIPNDRLEAIEFCELHVPVWTSAPATAIGLTAGQVTSLNALTATARAWAESHLKTLVREGPTVLVWTIEQQARTHPAEAAASKALTGLAEYLRPNIESLRYADRRREGRTIGSGQVEGACKTIVGRRLKLNSARWRVDMADRMAALGCLLYSDLWNRFWTPAAA